MPLTALERLQQLKNQGSPTNTKKSALDRIRELRGGSKEPASLPTPLPPQAQSPIRQAPSPFTMAKQNNILTNPSILSKASTFNVPEEMKPMPEQSTGDMAKGVATGLIKSASDAALRLGSQMPLTKPIFNLLPEDINISKISADLAKSTGLSQQEIDDRMKNLPDIIKQDISLKYSKDPKKAMGQLLNDGTWIAGGGAAGTVTKISNPFVRGAVLPIAGAVEGGAIGSASATGTALQQGKSFRESLNEGKKAFLPGAAFGAVLSPLAIGATLSKADKAQMATTKVAKAEQKVAQKQQKIVKKVTEGWDSALDVRTNRLQRFEEAEGKTLPEVMVEQQLPGLKKNKQGYIDAKATEQGAREAVKKLETTKQEIFSTRNQADINIDKLATEAKRKINDPSDRNYIVNAEDALKSAEDIDNYVNAFKTRENTSVLNVKQADMAKKGAWESAYEDLRPTKDKALRVFGNVLKDDIESKFVAENQNIIRQINKEEGALLGVIKALDVKGGKGVHGRVIRGGVLGKKFDELAGGYIGSMSGVPILGPLAGMKTAEMLNTYRYNPTRLTKNAIRDLQKAGLMPKWIKTEAEGRTFLKSKQAENLINSYKPKRLELPPAKEGAPRFGGGAVPERGGVIGIPQRKMTQFDKQSPKIGNQNSELKPGVARQMLDKQEQIAYEQQVISEIKNDIKVEFVGPLENQYDNFLNLLKDKRINFKKEAIQSGDVSSLKSSIKNVIPEEQIEKMLYSQDMSSDEVLDLFRARITKENPELLVGKSAASNLGMKKEIPNANELFAFAGGMEIQTDKDGKKKLVFNPKKAFASMAIVGAVRRAPAVVKKVSLPVNKELKTLVQEAKNYKSAEEFVKKNDPIEFYKVKPHKIGDIETGNYVNVSFFPKEIMKGQGITKSRLLDLMKDWKKEGFERITPYQGSFTEQGRGFIDTFIRDGYLTKDLRFTDKIDTLKTKSQLTDIWNKANKN